mgnify:CR=1 FL=1
MIICVIGLLLHVFVRFFDSGNADFYMRNVYGQSQVGATRVINAPCDFALRPVVSLNSNVTLTKNADGAWEIN